jgi:hypothetical protein
MDDMVREDRSGSDPIQLGVVGTGWRSEFFRRAVAAIEPRVGPGSAGALRRGHAAHECFVPLHRGAECGIDPREGLGRQGSASGRRVLGDLLGAGAADDRGGDVVVLQDPGDCELRHGEALGFRDRRELLHSSEQVIGEEALDVLRALLVGRAGPLLDGR